MEISPHHTIDAQWRQILADLEAQYPAVMIARPNFRQLLELVFHAGYRAAFDQARAIGGLSPDDGAAAIARLLNESLAFFGAHPPPPIPDNAQN